MCLAASNDKDGVNFGRGGDQSLTSTRCVEERTTIQDSLSGMIRNTHMRYAAQATLRVCGPKIASPLHVHAQPVGDHRRLVAAFDFDGQFVGDQPAVAAPRSRTLILGGFQLETTTHL